MAKNITFSQFFPSKHPGSGMPTHFVEMMCYAFGYNVANSIYLMNLYHWNEDKLQSGKLTIEQLGRFADGLNDNVERRKTTTIRKGNHWNVGDVFQPVVWSGKPYVSPQIRFLPEIIVEGVSNYKVENYVHYENDYELLTNEKISIAVFDGLDVFDFQHWFSANFDGQRIFFNTK